MYVPTCLRKWNACQLFVANAGESGKAGPLMFPDQLHSVLIGRGWGDDARGKAPQGLFGLIPWAGKHCLE